MTSLHHCLATYFSSENGSLNVPVLHALDLATVNVALFLSDFNLAELPGALERPLRRVLKNQCD
jgi:hypothetical protein